jgi:hypothetical protein
VTTGSAPWLAAWTEDARLEPIMMLLSRLDADPPSTRKVHGVDRLGS